LYLVKGNIMRQILLSIVGNTPQVVTETLWAIARDEHPWPERIHVITTTVGAAKVREKVLAAGVIARLSAEVCRRCPAFSEADIWIVPDAQGKEVADARTLADHEALANFIMTRVRDLTADPDSAVHASLAGGRKTMTFYLGYAMSLFGRTQDSLSHVLVSPEFENLPGFFYPTHRSEPLETFDKRKLNPAEAIVELADIPFIRHRHNLPPVFAESGGKPVDFRLLTNLINLGNVPERIRLEIDVPRRVVRVRDPDELTVELQPGLLEFAFYRMLVRATLENDNGFTRPTGKADSGLALTLCNELLALFDRPESDSLKTALTALESADDERPQKQLRLSTLESLSDNNGITGTWFDQRRNTLKTKFTEQLPDVLAQAVLPRIIWDASGQRLRSGQKPPKGGAYGIDLPSGQIRIIE
jgi:CRISPR-associated protein (TIGR02584 family)